MGIWELAQDLNKLLDSAQLVEVISQSLDTELYRKKDD